MKNRPSAEQAREFDGYVAKWQQTFSLGDWRVERGPRSAPRGAMASVEFNDPARLATYRLGDFGAEEINAHSLNAAALHEMLHVRLRDLIEAARNPATSEETLEAEEHKVINVLERLLMGGV